MTMANPVETIPHLGPYTIADVTDAMLQNLVCGQQKPLIIKQAHPASGGTLYAVLATKDVRMVCAGCFRRDMLITDATRCKKCASFVKHFDTKDGVRRRLCKEDGDVNHLPANCTEVVIKDSDVEPSVLDDVKLLWMVKQRDLVGRLIDSLNDEEKRELGKTVIAGMDDEAFASAIKERNFKSVIDAHPAELLHEVARQHGNTSAKSYYEGVKIEGQPHWTDKVEANLKVTEALPINRHGTRGLTRQVSNSVTNLYFRPMALNDRDWAVEIDDLTTKLVTDATIETTPKKRKANAPKKLSEKPKKISKKQSNVAKNKVTK